MKNDEMSIKKNNLNVYNKNIKLNIINSNKLINYGKNIPNHIPNVKFSQAKLAELGNFTPKFTPNNLGLFNNPRAGTYAITTIKKMPWLNTKTITTKTTSKKKNKYSTIYQIFDTYKDKINDPYWKSILENCTMGKFIKGFSYKNGLLKYRRKTKGEMIELPKNPYEAAHVAINFFKTFTGKRSSVDTKREKLVQEEYILKNLSNNTDNWRSVKSKKMKRSIILNFIYHLSHIKKLNKKQHNELETLIHYH